MCKPIPILIGRCTTDIAIAGRSTCFWPSSLLASSESSFTCGRAGKGRSSLRYDPHTDDWREIALSLAILPHLVAEWTCHACALASNAAASCTGLSRLVPLPDSRQDCAATVTAFVCCSASGVHRRQRSDSALHSIAMRVSRRGVEVAASGHEQRRVHGMGVAGVRNRYAFCTRLCRWCLSRSVGCTSITVVISPLRSLTGS
jgi:hypothetical protein